MIAGFLKTSSSLGGRTTALSDAQIRRLMEYFLGEVAWKRIDGQLVEYRRSQAPELIWGDGARFMAAIEGLRIKHKVTALTVTFEKDDIPVPAWARHDLVARAKVSNLVERVIRVAYPGVPEPCLPPVVVTTHTNTGRLELNFLLPRFVLNSAGKPRGFNPNPPYTFKSYWDLFVDTRNVFFGFADPGDPERRQDLRLPDAIRMELATARALGHTCRFEQLPRFVDEATALLRAKVWQSRADFIGQLRPVLAGYHLALAGPEGAGPARRGELRLTFSGGDDPVSFLLEGPGLRAANFGKARNIDAERKARAKHLAAAKDAFLELFRRRAAAVKKRFGYGEFELTATPLQKTVAHLDASLSRLLSQRVLPALRRLLCEGQISRMTQALFTHSSQNPEIVNDIADIRKDLARVAVNPDPADGPGGSVEQAAGTAGSPGRREPIGAGHRETHLDRRQPYPGDGSSDHDSNSAGRAFARAEEGYGKDHNGHGSLAKTQPRRDDHIAHKDVGAAARERLIHEIAGHLAILRKAAELTEAPPPAQPDEPVQARAEKAPAREGIFRRSVKALGQFSRRVIGQERAAQAPEIVEPESGLLPPGQVGPLGLPLPLVPKPVLPEHGQEGPQRGARSKKIREQAAPTIRRAPEEKTGKPLPPSRPKRKRRIPLQEGTEPVPGFVSEAAYRGDNAPDEIRPFEVPVADIGSVPEAESAAPENGDALGQPPEDSRQSLPSPWDDQG